MRFDYVRFKYTTFALETVERAQTDVLADCFFVGFAVFDVNGAA